MLNDLPRPASNRVGSHTSLTRWERPRSGNKVTPQVIGQPFALPCRAGEFWHPCGPPHSAAFEAIEGDLFTSKRQLPVTFYCPFWHDSRDINQTGTRLGSADTIVVERIGHK